MLFADRSEAGRRLADKLTDLRGQDVVVVGLPRGGVLVAAEVAKSLGADLDVIVVRKLGVPHQPELALGAVGEDGVMVFNRNVIERSGVGEQQIAEIATRERAEVQQRARQFRGRQARLPLGGRTVVIVDDGIATGATARAACQVARAQGAGRVVLAVPVAPEGTPASMRADADEVVCLHASPDFFAVGQFYRDFHQVPDEAVSALLRAGPPAAPRAAAAPAVVNADVLVHTGLVQLGGHLTVPAGPRGIVVFAHGSGSSRHSPRNRHVAAVLNRAGLATLLFDLLTAEEEGQREYVFDVALLARRLTDATTWLHGQPAARELPIGLFGASTGAAAALWAAADPGSPVAAVVSRGGRPDLAADRLPAVRAPTLLIVGGRDDLVLRLNRQAQALLRCPNRLALVPGATHLFEEPGTLDEAARLAVDWFADHLAGAARQAG